MEADKLIMEANNKKNSHIYNIINLFFCIYDKYDDSLADLYMQAGDLYNNNKDYCNAVDAYINALEYYDKKEGYVLVVDCYNKIYNCYTKLNDHSNVIIYLKNFSDYQYSKNNWSEAVNCEFKIGEIYETKYDYKSAIPNYEKALSYIYNNIDLTNKCLFKLAELNVFDSNYNNAYKYYKLYLENIEHNKKLKCKHLELILKILLCQLCLNFKNINSSIKLYYNNFPLFYNSAEYNFINGLVESLENDNLNKFDKHIHTYNLIKRIDQVILNLLSHIRNNLEKFDEIIFK